MALKSFFIFFVFPIVLFSQWKDLDFNEKKQIIDSSKFFLITVDDSEIKTEYEDLILNGISENLHGFVPIYDNLNLLKTGFNNRIWRFNGAFCFRPGVSGSFFPFISHVDDNIKKILIPNDQNSSLNIKEGFCALDYGNGESGATLIPVMLFSDSELNSFSGLLSSMLGDLQKMKKNPVSNLKKFHEFLINLVVSYDKESALSNDLNYRKKRKNFEKYYNNLNLGEVWETCFGYEIKQKKIKKIKIKDVNNGNRGVKKKKL